MLMATYVDDFWANYPDAYYFDDAAHTSRIACLSANDKVDKAFMQADEAGVVWVLPYCEDGKMIIHSDPPMVAIATEVHEGFGVEEIEGWEEELKGLNSSITKIVKNYLQSRPPIQW